MRTIASSAIGSRRCRRLVPRVRTRGLYSELCAAALLSRPIPLMVSLLRDPQVVALLGDNLRSSNEDVARSSTSAWSLFAEQASSSLDGLSSLSTGAASAAGGGWAAPGPPSRLWLRDAERVEPTSPRTSPVTGFSPRCSPSSLKRNRSEELFLMEP
jgi:hypothetical protein